MNSGDYHYIWQASDWPNWRFDLAAPAGHMAEVSLTQGLLMGRLTEVGMALRDEASLAVLTEEVVKTSEIEGEQLNVESVRGRHRVARLVPRYPPSCRRSGAAHTRRGAKQSAVLATLGDHATERETGEVAEQAAQ